MKFDENIRNICTYSLDIINDEYCIIIIELYKTIINYCDIVIIFIIT